MNDTTRAKALSALDGMREIVRREMLTRDTYIDEEITNPRLVGALCGGRLHCAIGSLWAGAGIKPKKNIFGNIILPGIILPGTHESERSDFLRPRHGLRAAYDALNRAAKAFAAKNELDLQVADYTAPIEALFEGYYGNSLTKQDLLKIISAAKRNVKAAA